MQKRGILFVFLFSLITLMAMNFVAASFHYGGYSLSDLLNTFDSSTVILTSIFLIAFILIFWPLSKFFRENALLAGIISFAMSFLLIFEINRRGLDFAGFFYSIGISEGILYTIFPLVLIIGLIFSGFRYGWGITLISVGLFFIGISFTDIIYSKLSAVTLGAIIFGIGILLWRRARRRGFRDYDYSNYSTSSGPRPRQFYKQELAERRYNEKVRQAQIKARAKNIQEISGVREKRNIARNQRKEKELRRRQQKA